MTSAFGILSIVVAVVLLVTVLVASPVLGAPVTVAEDNVEWAAANGDNISFVAPNLTGNFFVQDDALETIKSGTASWNTLGSNVGAHTNFTLGTGGPDNTNFAFTAPDYDAATPANTPVSEAPVVKVAGNQVFVGSFSELNGTFPLQEQPPERSSLLRSKPCEHGGTSPLCTSNSPSIRFRRS